jgi:hypothetical protein
MRFGYLADLGHFPALLAGELSDCDLLALEFNHDEQMELDSRRHARCKARVLGRHGHLSNDQAADALRRIVASSGADRLRWLVLLHISRDCNTPQLALAAARRALRDSGSRAEVLLTRQRECAAEVNLAPATVSHKPVASPLPIITEQISKPPRQRHFILEDFFGYE